MTAPPYQNSAPLYRASQDPVPDNSVRYETLSQLENELAVEKYRYKQQKAQEKNKQKSKETNSRQHRIRVFKIKPNKPPKFSTGMVEWQATAVAHYTNEKTLPEFAPDINSVNENGNVEDGLEDFIPIEIGIEPELVNEEPKDAPPNLRNSVIF
uniref:Uncharacterized protein n=1 Tax=Caenorhabditis japonica TaxID=281687 RepID=A0A8R1DK87_CAEJA